MFAGNPIQHISEYHSLLYFQVNDSITKKKHCKEECRIRAVQFELSVCAALKCSHPGTHPTTEAGAWSHDPGTANERSTFHLTTCQVAI